MTNYKITLRSRAAKEYLEAILWYKKRSLVASENFVKSVNLSLSKIEANPEYYRNIYKHFHEVKVQKYPYIIVYFLDKEMNRIVVTTIFHKKRNPKKKFGG